MKTTSKKNYSGIERKRDERREQERSRKRELVENRNR